MRKRLSAGISAENFCGKLVQMHVYMHLRGGMIHPRVEFCLLSRLPGTGLGKTRAIHRLSAKYLKPHTPATQNPPHDRIKNAGPLRPFTTDVRLYSSYIERKWCLSCMSMCVTDQLQYCFKKQSIMCPSIFTLRASYSACLGMAIGCAEVRHQCDLSGR